MGLEQKNIKTIKNIKVEDVYKFLDKIAPFDTAMGFDNCGLLVGDMKQSVKKVLLALDITVQVVKEAKRLGANLVISHHPIIFSPLKKIEFGSAVSMLIENKISAICAHTNLDMAGEYGVNACLAKALGLCDTEPLFINEERFFNKIAVFAPKGYEDKILNAMCENGAGELGSYSGCGFISKGEGRFKPGQGAKPFLGMRGKEEKAEEVKVEVICPRDITNKIIKKMLEVHPYETPAYDVLENKALSQKIVCGLVGELSAEVDSRTFAKLVKDKLRCEGIRYTETNKQIKKIGVCSGAGGDYLEFAAKKGADAFVTGEIKHHMILRANELNIAVFDAGHFKSEDIVFDTLKKVLEREFFPIEFHKSADFTDRIKYCF